MNQLHSLQRSEIQTESEANKIVITMIITTVVLTLKHFNSGPHHRLLLLFNSVHYHIHIDQQKLRAHISLLRILF